MGSFSWLKADELTEIANIVGGKPFKFLIPKEFGGGFIKDNYQDYGYLGTQDNGESKFDMYELLAFWNTPNKVKYDGEFPLLKEIDEYTDENRSIGIDIGCYDVDIDKLKYPLKLVSCSYKGNYEDCESRSYGDPNQGWGVLTRKEYNKMKKKHEEEMKDYEKFKLELLDKIKNYNGDCIEFWECVQEMKNKYPFYDVMGCIYDELCNQNSKKEDE